MPGGKEDKKDPRPQRNSALLDNLGNNNLEPIENADRLSVRSMPSQRRYPGNAAGPRPGALPGQANESVLKAMKENASPLNVVPKNLNPPQGKEPEEPKKPNPPQGKEPKAAKDPNIIDLEEEEIGIPNLGLRPLVQKQPLIQVPAQNIPANVPNAVIGQPGEIPAPAFPLGPYWTRDEVEPDMIAEHGKGQLKKEAGNNPDDNDRIRNDQLDIEELIA